MVAADTKGSNRETARRRDWDRDGNKEKRRKMGSRRAAGKSMEAHSETTWEQNIARRTAQGSPQAYYLPVDRAGDFHMHRRHWQAGCHHAVPADQLSGNVTEHREHWCEGCRQCQPTDCAGERVHVREGDTNEPDAVRTISIRQRRSVLDRVNYMQEKQLRENNQQDAWLNTATWNTGTTQTGSGAQIRWRWIVN